MRSRAWRARPLRSQHSEELRGLGIDKHATESLARLGIDKHVVESLARPAGFDPSAPGLTACGIGATLV